MAILDMDIFLYIKAYNFMEKGILPNVGGWLDQSNKFLEVITFIGNEVKDVKK